MKLPEAVGVIAVASAIGAIAYGLHLQDQEGSYSATITKGLTVEGEGYKVTVGPIVTGLRGDVTLEAPTFTEQAGKKPAWLSCKLLDANGNLVGGGGHAGLVNKIGGTMQVEATHAIEQGSLACTIVPHDEANPPAKGQ